MPDSWDLKTEDYRIENLISTFIIFCEDDIDEPMYFRSFQIPNILKVNVITNQNKAKINLNNTLKKCLDDGLMDFTDAQGFKIKEGITENIWCVYDRDFENTNLALIEPGNDIDFTTSINLATAAGIKVAWSNDAFELWVLLHLENIPNGNRLHRNYIYERLKILFKTTVDQTDELVKINKHALFSYKTNLKRREAFYRIVLPILKANTHQAITRAQALEATYPANTPFHNCNPCTKVHHLVLELLAYQI
jgi:hypothetical protein